MPPTLGLPGWFFGAGQAPAKEQGVGGARNRNLSCQKLMDWEEGR
jgi:hypothetical protein